MNRIRRIDQNPAGGAERPVGLDFWRCSCNISPRNLASNRWFHLTTLERRRIEIEKSACDCNEKNRDDTERPSDLSDGRCRFCFWRILCQTMRWRKNISAKGSRSKLSSRRFIEPIRRNCETGTRTVPCPVERSFRRRVVTSEYFVTKQSSGNRGTAILSTAVVPFCACNSGHSMRTLAHIEPARGGDDPRIAEPMGFGPR